MSRKPTELAPSGDVAPKAGAVPSAGVTSGVAPTAPDFGRNSQIPAAPTAKMAATMKKNISGVAPPVVAPESEAPRGRPKLATAM